MSTKKLFDFPAPYLSAAKKQNVEIIPLTEKNFKSWVEELEPELQTQMANQGFKGKPGQTFILHNDAGIPEKMIVGVNGPLLAYDFAHATVAAKRLADDFIEKASFSIAPGLKQDELEKASIAWGLACYNYDAYKKNGAPVPKLVMPKGIDKDRVAAHVEAISLIRNLVNTPAGDLGPAELAKAAKKLGGDYEAKVEITQGDELEKEFPMIHAVGKGSPRAPRLIDLKWGDKKHPKLTIVGKGVVFDTGGLDIKPSQYMRLMKKDMGGAAHALGLALMIMKLNLPVRLRVLIPAVENSVSGEAFRPGDVLKSRKGITVEVGNTDAEGRLVLGDALDLACEEKPDLLIDFATLTGAARTALGPDIPALFSNNEKMLDEIRKLSQGAEDPVWPLPLWKPYLKDMQSDIADTSNDATGPAGAIHAALFLDRFVKEGIDWFHLDMFAWENAGKPGRPKGGADTGLKTSLAFIEKRFGPKP